VGTVPALVPHTGRGLVSPIGVLTTEPVWRHHGCSRA